MGRIKGVTEKDVRQRLLDAGARLLGLSGESHGEKGGGEGEGGSVLGSLNVRELSRKADLSTGAFYSRWPGGIAEFLPDLGRYYIESSETYLEDIKRFKKKAQRTTGPLAVVLEKVAEYEFALMLGSRRPWLAELELVVRLHTDEAFAQASATGYNDMDRIFGQIYESLLTRYGRSFTRPWNAASAYRVLQALLEGAMLRTLVDPHAGFIETGRDKGLYAKAARAFLTSITEPTLPRLNQSPGVPRESED